MSASILFSFYYVFFYTFKVDWLTEVEGDSVLQSEKVKQNKKKLPSQNNVELNIQESN